MRQPKVDDVIVFHDLDSTRKSLADGLHRAFDRAAELAIKHGATSPLVFSLLDADAKCLLKMTMVVGDGEWSRRTEGCEPDSSDIPFSWFVVVTHHGRQVAAVRVGLDSQSTPKKRQSRAVGLRAAS